MKPTLRFRLATALLLAPTAALMAVPASAQHGVVLTQHGVVVVQPHPAPPGLAPAPVTIDRFVLRPGGRIVPGRELRFVLAGMPGGQAWADIPGTARLDLREVRPGVYEGHYTVRRRDNPDAFERTVGTLQRGNQRVTAQVELRGGGVARDERPPQVTDMTPLHGERVGEWRRTQIAARLSDEGSGIDVDSVRLRVDGRDVTDRARIGADEVRYRGDLGNGRHTAEITVRDRAGNVTRRAWSFDVVDHGPRDGDRQRDGEWHRDDDGRRDGRRG
jgi:hypothetical protein